MSLLDSTLNLIRTFLPLLLVLAAVVGLLWASHWLLLRRHPELGPEQRLPRQLILLLLVGCGVAVIVLALPVTSTVRDQLLSLLGLIVTAVIALSSTTFVANAMAGLMLRSTRNFHTGDFIRVGDQFGRVTERGLLHTEIQTEHRELTTLPNLYLIQQPVTVVRSSGTIVSVSVSLGYDIHHARIEPLLLEAARRAELEEPFVRYMELGNFAITYRIAGFLPDVKSLLTVRSNLAKHVLETLHEGNVEIVSPNFMNLRQLRHEEQMIPPPVEEPPQEEQPRPEERMFDKAEQAERVEREYRSRLAEIEQMEKRLETAEGEDRERLEKALAERKKQAAELATAAHQNDADDPVNQ